MATTLQEINAVATATWLTQKSINASLNNIPLLYYMNQKGSFVKKDFSAGIKVPTILARKSVKATDGSGTGMTVHNDQANFAAEVAWKTVPAKVIITKDIIDLRKSKEQIVEAILGQFVATQSSILNTLNDMIYGDGTGDGGKAIDGLALAVSKTPESGVYAGIDPSVITQWRNYAADATDVASGLPNAGAPLDATNILDVVDFVVNKLSANGKSVDTLVVGDYYYNLISKAIRALQRIVDSGIGEAGFRVLSYAGVKIINAGGIKRDSSLIPTYSGIGEKEMYFLSLEDIHFAYHNPYSGSSEAKELGLNSEDINAIVYPEMANGMILHKDQDTLDYYANLVFKGNMVLSDRKIHGVVYES